MLFSDQDVHVLLKKHLGFVYIFSYVRVQCLWIGESLEERQLCAVMPDCEGQRKGGMGVQTNREVGIQ